MPMSHSMSLSKRNASPREVVGVVVGVAVAAGEDAELLRLGVPVEDRAVRAVAGAVDRSSGSAAGTATSLSFRTGDVELERLVLDQSRCCRSIRPMPPSGRRRIACGPCSRCRPPWPSTSIVSITSSPLVSCELDDRGRTVAAATAATAAASALRRRRRLRRELRCRFDEHARSVHRRAVEPQALTVADLVADDLLRLRRCRPCRCRAGCAGSPAPSRRPGVPGCRRSRRRSCRSCRAGSRARC